MSVDIIARAMAAAARSAGGSGSSTAVPIGRFIDLPTRTIDAAWSAVVTSGYAAAGTGRGSYVADSIATAALASAHPRFCKADAVGRYFRLLPDDEGLIPVACGGAVGFSAEPADSDTPPNDRAAIAAAEAYRHAIGAAGLRFDARRYAYWRVPLPAGTDYFVAWDFVPFTVRSAAVWKSTHPSGTDLYRRKPTGQRPDVADRESTTGIVEPFRGGCIFLPGLGTGADPGPAANAFTLDGIRLQGGLLRSLPGLGFELFDKAVWQQNDQYGGNLTFKNGAGVIGFASELVYQSSANGTSAVLRTLTVEDGCIFGETKGSCLNTGATLRVGRALLYNSSVGYEGWLGEDGYLRAIFRNTGGWVQGGTVHQVAGEHFSWPTRTGSGLVPVGNIDIRLEKCTSFAVGSWISGRIEAIDTPIQFGNSFLFEKGSRDSNIEVISWLDTIGSFPAVSILGATVPNRNLYVKLHLKRTYEAELAGLTHSNIIGGNGVAGPQITVDLGEQYADWITPVSSDLDTTNFMPILRNWTYHVRAGMAFFDAEANNGGTLTRYPLVNFSCSSTATGTKNVNLPTTNVSEGFRIWVRNGTTGFVAGGIPVKVNGGAFRSGVDLVLAPGYTMACFEYEGFGYWRVVERP